MNGPEHGAMMRQILLFPYLFMAYSATVKRSSDFIVLNDWMIHTYTLKTEKRYERKWPWPI
jgi:hypothetical protein